MKILIIGDIHGTSVWKDIEPYLYDKIIFLGDYIDSFDVGDAEMIYNLKSIIDFKKDNAKKVTLLIGNHDNQYMLRYDKNVLASNGKISVMCSGFRAQIFPQLYELFNENKSLFQAAYQIDNYLFSHAGLSRRSYNLLFKDEYENIVKNNKKITLSDYLNKLYDDRDYRLFNISYYRGGGNRVGGIFWADMRETSGKFNVLNNYNQIVGHTPVQSITSSVFENGSITYCDTQQYNNGTYYKLELNFISNRQKNN